MTLYLLSIAECQSMLQLSNLKQLFIISHDFCVSRIWKWLSWRVLAQDPSWDCSEDVGESWRYMEGYLGLQNPLPRWLAHTLARQFSFLLVVDRRPQFLTMKASPWGCLGILLIWQLASEEREHDKSQHTFYDLALEVTYHHFCFILLVTVWEGTT